jgi:uncharacterized protein YegP (UPF0339 family)
MVKSLRRVVLVLILAAVLTPAGLDLASAQTKDKDKAKDKDKPAPMAVFELYKDSGDKFRFRLKDGEGTILAIASKGYDTKAECQKAIDAIKSLAAKAKVDDQAGK